MKDLRTIAALVTPFTLDDTVNHSALRAIVEHAISLGVHGFYVCGTTGEGFQMSTKERQQTLETVCETNCGRCEIFANISHMDFRESCLLADHAQEVGADKVSALPPIYNAITTKELIQYLNDLLNHVRLPFALYHIPMLSDRVLSVNDIALLAQHPKFIGIKYTSEDTSLLGCLKQFDNGRLHIWSARDEYYLSNLSMGADGAIGSSFQLMGDLFNAVSSAYQRGEIDLAYQLQLSINDIRARLSRHGSYQSYKACFELMGIPAGGCRKPFGKLPADAMDYLREVLALLDQTRHKYAIPDFQNTTVLTP